MASGPMVRMNELDKVEKEVVNCLGSAGKALEEIGKDKPSQKQVDNLVSQFMTSLQVKIECDRSFTAKRSTSDFDNLFFKEIDSKLTENIKYLSQVSTGQPHEGSSYASQKVSHGHNLTAAVYTNIVIRCCRWPGTGWSTPGAGWASWTGEQASV